MSQASWLTRHSHLPDKHTSRRRETPVVHARRKVAPAARPPPIRRKQDDDDGFTLDEYMALDGDDGALEDAPPDHRSGAVITQRSTSAPPQPAGKA